MRPVHLYVSSMSISTASIALPGIPPEQLDQVFKQYWRADRSRSSGTGPGLGIATGIVEAHHGTISIENAEGGGTQVTLTFPSRPTAHM